ncbi:MAG: HAMP domain-containing protein [Nitrospiraceae bacterium]
MLCALLPVGALSLVSFGDVTHQLTQQAERRVRQESKAMGMAIYQRLLLLQAELLSSGWGTGVFAGPSREAASKSGFSGIARLRPSEPPEVLGGAMSVAPTLSQAQWMLLRSGKTLLVSENRPGDASQLFLAKVMASGEGGEQALLAEIASDYLWGADSIGTLPSEMTMCVFGETAALFCSDDVSAPVREQWAQQAQVGGTAVFEGRDGDDLYTAGYWTIPLKFEFSAEPWVVILSQPRSEVLAPLASFRYRFTIVVLLAVLFVALLSVMQIRKTMVPLEQLGEGTRRIARRDFSTAVQVTSGDEFETLAGSFNAMSSKIAQQFSQLATMHEIDRSVLSLLDPSLIVDTVLVRLREVSPCEAVAVLLLDPSQQGRGWWYARAGRGAAQTTVEGVEIDEAIGKLFLEHRDRVRLSRDAAGALFGRLCVPDVESVHIFPLFRSQQVLGCIALGYPAGAASTREAQDLLRQLADQVAVALSNASDLAERKRAEAELRDSNAKLEGALVELKTTQQHMVQQERLRALGQMASGIAHDFNNTLSPIVGFSELLLIDPQMSDNKAQLTEYLQTINLAAKDAAKVVSRLREFYRPRTEADLVGVVDLNRLVEQNKLSQPKWKDQALSHGVTVEVRSELEAPVAGHESELREVLTNLTFNAAYDAMPKSGSITLRTKADGGDYVRGKSAIRARA